METTKPIHEKGLPPGASLHVKFKEPYSNCLGGFIDGIGKAMDMEVEKSIIDPENNLMEMTIREYKFGPLTFKKIKANIRFKGSGKEGTCTLDLTIDDKLYDQVPWITFEWL